MYSFNVLYHNMQMITFRLIKTALWNKKCYRGCQSTICAHFISLYCKLILFHFFVSASPPRDVIRHAPSLASVDSDAAAPATSNSTPSLCSPHTLRPDDPRSAFASPASHRSMNSLYEHQGPHHSRRHSRASNRSHRSNSSHERINKSSSLPDISSHSPKWDIESGGEDSEHCTPVIGPETEMVYKTLTRKLMFLDVARKGRLFSQRTRERLIYKSGESNISNANVHRRRFRYIVDIFTTLLELSWGYSILLYTLSFFIS